MRPRPKFPVNALPHTSSVLLQPLECEDADDGAGAEMKCSGEKEGTAAAASALLSPDAFSGAGLAARRTGVPLWDPLWRAAFERAQRAHTFVARGAVQSPHDYRAYCEAALAGAAQPEAMGLEGDAVEVCCRMLG